MSSLDNCFIDQVTEPLHLIEVDQRQPARCSAHLQLSTAQELAAHFDQNRDYSCRLISICQRNSWQPLQTSRSMLDLIVAKNSISSQFWDLPSCFYRRNLEVEEVFCVPYSETREGPITEISYTLKYPEYKPRTNEWVIRQTGIHHRFNSTTGQSVYVLFNPVPSSKVHLAAQERLRDNSQETKTEPFWLHRILFATYFPAWRQYIAALEREFLPIANGVNVAYIDEPLRVGFENLSTTMSLQKRFLQISTLLAPAADVLDAMDILLKSISQTIATHPGTQKFKNYNRQCIAYSRMATNLQHRSQMTAQLLTDTLSFRDQVVAKQQNENMLQLNKSAVFVTFLTLFYLPASFLTSFFGMNFFDLDQDAKRIVGTPMIWIFIISTIFLTAITVFIYYWRVQREAKRRVIPRIPIDWNWKTMTRGLEMRKLNLDMSQKDSQA